MIVFSVHVTALIQVDLSEEYYDCIFCHAYLYLDHSHIQSACRKDETADMIFCYAN